MELHYQNTTEDFGVYFDNVHARTKRHGKSDYYHSMLWYLTVLGLGMYVSLLNDEGFIACVFATLAIFYLWQNFSYARHWRVQLDQYARSVPPQSCTLQVDEEGLTESFSGVVLKVPWGQIHRYSITAGHLLIHFLTERAFIIPFRHLNQEQRDQLLEILKSRNLLATA